MEDVRKAIYTPFGCEGENPFMQDISAIPHILVSGVSGSGKTSYIQTIMTFLSTTYGPEFVRFMVINAKPGEYSAFERGPMLIVPIMYTVEGAACNLMFAKTESIRRCKMFSGMGVKSLLDYNAAILAEGGYQCRLPDLFVVLDDWDFFARNADIAAEVIDLLRYGRTAGVHLILIATNCSSKTLQHDILPNITCRISFSTISKRDSELVIQQGGAERLHSPGELIFKYERQLKKCASFYIPFDCVIMKMQTFNREYIDIHGDSFMNERNARIKEQPIQADLDDELDEDELLPEAVEVILETQRADVATVQRALKIGYARAARIIDEMEERGIVGPFMGSKPRKILITRDTWQDMCNGKSKEAGSSFQKAVDVILETQQASVSMIQRRLRLGYAHAANLIDEIEDAGLIGPFEGAKPRKILITMEEWKRIRNRFDTCI